MSLVANFVMAEDGQWYEDPTIYGEFEGKKWFLCFDDDDPPELVVEEIDGAKSRTAILKQGMRRAFVHKLVSSLRKDGLVLTDIEFNQISGRIHGKMLLQSHAYFCRLRKRLPLKFIDGRKKALKFPSGVFLDPEAK